jgi:UDPglucose--hexose-1-phosphate uridylyltransferase
MPELRTDHLIGRSVFIAENRAGRPNEFESTAGRDTPSHPSRGQTPVAPPACPFCPGNEAGTPPAVYEQRDDDGQWRLRVVPNKYPALTMATSLPHSNPLLTTASPRPTGEGLDQRPAIGVHEVVIESARHVESATDLSVPELADVLATYAERLNHWHNDGRFRYGLVFKNLGRQAGASLSHVHSQLVALPDLPPVARRELARAKDDYESHRECPYCRWIQRERTSGARVVMDGEGFVAFCPFASLLPYEVWLMPTSHEPWFERGDFSGELARVLHELLRRVEATVPGAGYNLLLRTAPWDDSSSDCCHWRIEVLPRVVGLAGFELATGVHINPLAPEHAARQMR